MNLVACGGVDSVLAAGLVVGWLNLLQVAGLNQVCWVVVIYVPFPVVQVTSCLFWPFLASLVHLILNDCIVV